MLCLFQIHSTVSFNREINGLTVENEAGEAVTACRGSNSRHYTLQLNQGETVYFIINAGENWKTLRVKVTKGNAITSVTLNTSRKGQDSYYVGIDELDKRDFYLDITYADGGKYRLNAGSSVLLQRQVQFRSLPRKAARRFPALKTMISMRSNF